jgi:hypothetical protein
MRLACSHNNKGRFLFPAITPSESGWPTPDWSWLDAALVFGSFIYGYRQEEMNSRPDPVDSMIITERMAGGGFSLIATRLAEGSVIASRVWKDSGHAAPCFAIVLSFAFSGSSTQSWLAGYAMSRC